MSRKKAGSKTIGSNSTTPLVAGLETHTAEQIATSIVQISEGMRRLGTSRLKQEAIITLIHDHSRVAKSTIRIVLNNLDQLERTWLKPQ